MATTLGTRRSSKRTVQDTGFDGKPLTFQSELPATSGIATEYAPPPSRRSHHLSNLRNRDRPVRGGDGNVGAEGEAQQEHRGPLR